MNLLDNADCLAFHRACLDAPDCPAPRLVWADWLDENGLPVQAERLRMAAEVVLAGQRQQWPRPARGRMDAGFAQSIANATGHGLVADAIPWVVASIAHRRCGFSHHLLRETWEWAIGKGISPTPSDFADAIRDDRRCGYHLVCSLPIARARIIAVAEWLPSAIRSIQGEGLLMGVV